MFFNGFCAKDQKTLLYCRAFYELIYVSFHCEYSNLILVALLR